MILKFELKYNAEDKDRKINHVLLIIGRPL